MLSLRQKKEAKLLQLDISGIFVLSQYSQTSFIRASRKILSNRWSRSMLGQRRQREAKILPLGICGCLDKPCIFFLF
jgi:hypothetical protein